MVSITKQESAAINTIRYICIFFCVCLHTCYSHLSDASVRDDLECIQGAVIIPFLQILFVLSGYLFFAGVKTQEDRFFPVYVKKLKKRIRTLFVPYLIWSGFSISYNYFVKNIAPPQGLGWITCLWDAGGGAGHPIGMALWYIKSLIVFSLLSPLYFYLVKYLKNGVIIIVLLLLSIDIPLDYPYFSVYLLIGSYLAIMGYSLQEISNKFDKWFCLAIYLSLIIAEVFLQLPAFCHRVVEISCLMFLLGIFMNHGINKKIAVTSTFIYFSHPFFTGIRNVLIKFVHPDNIFHLVSIWFLTALLIVSICTLIFFLIKKNFPKLLSLVTGDRI